VLTKCFTPSCNISLGPAYTLKLKTSWNIARLANIARHKERSMDTYQFWTNNKLLTHGTQLQLIPLDHRSFHSHHNLQNQKSLQHFKYLQSSTSTCTSWKLWYWKTRNASLSLTLLTKFGSVATPAQLIACITMGHNLSQLNFKNFFNHMEFDPNWPLSKTLKPMVSSNAPTK
jgi:hypothetical protein